MLHDLVLYNFQYYITADERISIGAWTLIFLSLSLSESYRLDRKDYFLFIIHHVCDTRDSFMDILLIIRSIQCILKALLLFDQVIFSQLQHHHSQLQTSNSDSINYFFCTCIYNKLFLATILYPSGNLSIYIKWISK